MSVDETDGQLHRIFRSMGEPSWWVLAALAANPNGLAPFQIVRYVESALESVKSPIRKLDPGTLHYALPRMDELGIIESAGQREVDVPVGHGATRVEMRPTWVITALGQLAIARRDSVHRALAGQGVGNGVLRPGLAR